MSGINSRPPTLLESPNLEFYEVFGVYFTSISFVLYNELEEDRKMDFDFFLLKPENLFFSSIKERFF